MYTCYRLDLRVDFNLPKVRDLIETKINYLTLTIHLKNQVKILLDLFIIGLDKILVSILIFSISWNSQKLKKFYRPYQMTLKIKSHILIVRPRLLCIH
jgi:hypothetical protein